MKLATKEDLLENRHSGHKYIAKKGSCDRCGGRGWWATEFEEVYCGCAAGAKRKELEQSASEVTEASEDTHVSAYELFHSYRRGWQDASSSKEKDPKFVEHKTRPDLTVQYNRGYAAGRHAFNEAMGLEMKRVGYDPSPLRGSSSARA